MSLFPCLLAQRRFRLRPMRRRAKDTRASCLRARAVACFVGFRKFGGSLGFMRCARTRAGGDDRLSRDRSSIVTVVAVASPMTKRFGGAFCAGALGAYIRLRIWPMRPKASRNRPCEHLGNPSNSARTSGHHSTCGTSIPLSASRPRIDWARTVLSPLVGNISIATGMFLSRWRWRKKGSMALAS